MKIVPNNYTFTVLETEQHVGTQKVEQIFFFCQKLCDLSSN